MSSFSLLPPYAVKLNVPLISAYVLMHLSLLAAPFTFSWEGLTVFGVMYFATICLGITLGYHRLLAHRSYQVPKILSYIMATLGCLAFQRGPIWWVATHRLHHGVTDTPQDPHSPRFSLAWAHFLWPFFQHPDLTPDKVSKLARDMVEDPVFRFLERHYTSLNVGFLALLFAVGYVWQGLHMGLSFLIWGGAFRIMFCLNVTWLVNSAAHRWGYRRFETPDDSRNTWWVALLTFGEGWHNNHHAHARSARMGLTWYELDVTYGIIRLLKSLGLAKRVVTPST
jgi:fatty-acid desaturase